MNIQQDDMRSDSTHHSQQLSSIFCLDNKFQILMS